MLARTRGKERVAILSQFLSTFVWDVTSKTDSIGISSVKHMFQDSISKCDLRRIDMLTVRSAE